MYKACLLINLPRSLHNVRQTDSQSINNLSQSDLRDYVAMFLQFVVDMIQSLVDFPFQLFNVADQGVFLLEPS